MFETLPFRLETAFDPQSLQAYALHPLQVESALVYLQSRLRWFAPESSDYIYCLTQRALLRQLQQDFTGAIQDFVLLIQHWENQNTPEAPQRLLSNRLRLANTYHLAEDFVRSNPAFETLLEESAHWQREQQDTYLHFLWQHAGKNAYAQGRWSEAAEFFQKALAKREQLKDLDLIASSRLALQQALNKSAAS